MNITQNSTIKLENDSASLTVDPFGGAITAFRLAGNQVNPLSFVFATEQMPANNKAGANYQGHFACIGRWGPPSAGEIKAGLPNHGEPANIQWTIKEKEETGLQMQAIASKEGLQVDRTIVLDKQSPVYFVKEIVANINPLGRLYNIVQHPSLAVPFLDQNTIIDCNALHGFDQAHYKQIASNTITWPVAKDDRNNLVDLRNPHASYNAVYTFIVDPKEEFGWITAFSPTHHLLFGYVWKRTNYPWVHLWQHYNHDLIQYRGIEFGTAGIHQPFREILSTAPFVFGENTFEYIDAGESISKGYCSFIHDAPVGFTGVEKVYFTNDQLLIKGTDGDHINIQLSQQITHELSK